MPNAPLIASAIAPVGGPPDQEHWLFRLPQGANVMAYPIIEHMKKTGVKTVGFLGYADAYGEIWLKAMVPALEKAGIKLVATERFARSDTSVTPQALKLVSANPDAMKRHAGSFDFILDTVSVPHDLDALTALLKRDATLCLVGAPSQPHPSPAVFSLVFKRRQIAGSLIGGIRETQEMLDFCAVHGITSDIELIRMQDINTAYERMLKSDVKYRFVIDMKSLV